VTIGGTVSPAGGNFEEPVTQATLKVVGCFQGLSRERSDARRYPAIHPLDSWSKYPSFIEEKHVEYGRRILREGNEVNQMMKVVGEEGVTVRDFELYMKSEFLDSVYLQQNTFDTVDCATSMDRQKRVFERVYEVLSTRFKLDSKEDAREFFNALRQMCIDWNYISDDSPEFEKKDEGIKNIIQERKLQS